jgi:predicted helicase
VLMAPYAIAHFKLGLELLALDLPEEERSKWKVADSITERLGVFLTNTLEPPHEFTGLPLFTQWLSEETNAANEIKTEAPIMVVLGNPPYNNFGQQNCNPYISDLITDYKKGLGERKLNLDDDYIKFIRFAQDRIERTGYGIVAFITNSSFIGGIVHRRMRQSLRETFSDIFVLNLHGSGVIGETAPGGESDANVFDIKQGVAATIFVKAPGGKTPGAVWYADLWGTRANKYDVLSKSDVSSIKWERLKNIEAESCLGKFSSFDRHQGPASIAIARD